MADELTKKWWGKNKPDCLKKSELDKCVAEFEKTVKAAADKNWDAAPKVLESINKVIEKTKKALAKDMAETKKAKDAKAQDVMKDIEKVIDAKCAGFEKHLDQNVADKGKEKFGLIDPGKGSAPAAPRLPEGEPITE